MIRRGPCVPASISSKQSGSLHLDETGPALEARAVAMTGEAVVRVSHADHGIVSGELVNSASRLQADAQPGTVLVDGTDSPRCR